MEIPKIGAIIQICSLKHNNELHRRWEENTVLYSDPHLIIGGNNQTIVVEGNGKKWRTIEPAIFYFHRHYWFNIIKICKGSDSFYYCNLCSPYMYHNQTIHYIDYDIDVIVKTDLSYKIVDQDEFEINKRKYNYPPFVQRSIDSNLLLLQSLIEKKQDPFNPSFIEYWYHQFLK